MLVVKGLCKPGPVFWVIPNGYHDPPSSRHYDKSSAWPLRYILGPSTCQFSRPKPPHWVVCKTTFRPTTASSLISLRPQHWCSVGCQLPCCVLVCNTPLNWISMFIFYVLIYSSMHTHTAAAPCLVL